VAATKKIQDVAVVVPAFNEAKRIKNTIEDLSKNFSKIIVVDDGSSDETVSEISKTGITPVRHPINLGQGAALQTGIDVALLDPKVNAILTFDADGQHSIESALLLVEEIKKSGCEIILGSRYCPGAETFNMPWKKRIILRLAILFTRFDSGLKVTDTHNGLRIMTREFASGLRIRQNGMAHASEILNHVSNSKVSWKEVPVRVYYTEYSNKKGQSVWNSVNIITELISK
jgi:glycosyltransferase involved in cell wall biosynthesis